MNPKNNNNKTITKHEKDNSYHGNYRENEKPEVKTKVAEINSEILSSEQPKSTISEYGLARKSQQKVMTTTTAESLDALAGGSLDVGDQAATLTANVANLYSLEGYTGMPFIGNSIPASDEDNTGTNILPTNILTAMASVDTIDSSNVGDRMGKANTLGDTVKFKPAIWLTFNYEQIMGIKSLLTDDSLLTNNYVFMMTDILTRAQAAELTVSDVLSYDTVDCTLNGNSVKILAVCFIYYYELILGNALANLIRSLNSIQSEGLDISNFSRSWKLKTDVTLSEFNRSSSQSKLDAFYDQVSLFTYCRELSEDFSDAFNANYRERTGRVSPFIKTRMLSYVPDLVDIKYKGVTIVSRELLLNILYMINRTIIVVNAWINKMPLKYIKEKFSKEFNNNNTDGRYDNVAGIPSWSDILNDLSDIRVYLLNYTSKMPAYIKFKTVMMNTGLFGKLETINPSDCTINSENKKVAQWTSFLQNSVGTTLDFGTLVSMTLDLTKIDDYIASPNLGAFYSESDLDNPRRITHYPVVTFPEAVFGNTSWFGHYDIDLIGKDNSGVILPHLRAHEFIPSLDNAGAFKNDNLAINRLSSTRNAGLDICAGYSFNQAGTTTRGIMLPPYYYGSIKVLVPSITPVLNKYMQSLLPGGGDDLSNSLTPTIKTI